MTIAMIGVTKKLAIILSKFVDHMKNNIIGKTHNVAPIVGVMYSFTIFFSIFLDFVVIVDFFSSFLVDRFILLSMNFEK
jgi:hypothetical protein